MTLGIYAFGHGGGVPGAFPGTPVGSNGNTNFALIPNIDVRDRAEELLKSTFSFLDRHPFWLIDCGPETMLALSGVMPGTTPVARNVKGIFLTHMHNDHSGGLASLGYRCRFYEKTKPRLMHPDALGDILWAQLVEFNYLNTPGADMGKGIDAFYEQRIMPLNMPMPYITKETEGFEIQPFLVDHNLPDFPAFGYVVRSATKTTITFSGDTAFPLSRDAFVNSDVIIHDVQFYAEKQGDGPQTYVHCPYKELRDAVPPEHRHKVYLTHTGHDLPPEAIADGFTKLFKHGDLLLAD